ncbi:tetratricopeptide repeat protein, partial [Ideonella sp.]|uniref:tetratricopeptide repeat protein n=1 Tax=Ideonella sp. TaxID=1929293 RepID=UPI003BB58C3A
PILNSPLDAPMFYQLLIGEMEAQAGRQGNAFEVLLDAARRTRDGVVFQRAIELAVQGRSGERALAAAQAWRSTLPNSSEAVRTQVQLLVALERLDDLPEPLRLLIEQVPAAERASVIAGLPRFLAGARDKTKALAIAETTLSPFLVPAATRPASRTALGRLALAANQPEKALVWMKQARVDDPVAAGPVLLALDLMASSPDAEAHVLDYLSRPEALVPLRLAYVQALDQKQRIGEAVQQLRIALAAQPDSPQAWLTLGAYLVDLQEPREAIGAIQQYLKRAETPEAQAAEAAAAPAEDDDREDRSQRRTDYAWMLLAQAHEQLGQTQEALRWMDRIEPSRLDLSLLSRRANLLARLGQIDAARSLVREAPARDNPGARARLLAEAQVLREGRRLQAAYDLLLRAVREDPDDSGAIYELAMVAEQLARHDDMEALLRRVMTLKPDDAHAYNALGYSLAERNVRLPEAEALVRRAAELAPDDPFIKDSLGWVAFRQGDLVTAQRLLDESYKARPHAEVAAHLGEVLWLRGERDAAMRIWREGRDRAADNEVLRATLRRLKVSL